MKRLIVSLALALGIVAGAPVVAPVAPQARAMGLQIVGFPQPDGSVQYWFCLYSPGPPPAWIMLEYLYTEPAPTNPNPQP